LKSTEGRKIDAESLFLDKINGILLKACWVDTVKDLVGLQAISQVWETPPAWYVWMNNAHGVYKLQLAQSEQIDDRGLHLNGIFTVKCFPYTHSALFKTFSPEERELRTSTLFDETHTPKFEYLDQLPEDAFNVAMIECNLTDGAFARFTLESLSELRTVGVPTPDDGTLARRRCVPGWRLGRSFFNWLLAVYAFESRTMPTRIRLSRSPGFETFQTNSRNVEYQESLDIHCYTASVDFGQVDNSPAIEKDFHEQGDVLLDGTFHNLDKPDHSFIEKASDLFPIDDLWWSLADANYPSQLGSTCGCSHHHNHSHLCRLPVLSNAKGSFST